MPLNQRLHPMIMNYILSILLMFPMLAMAEKSTCFGTTSSGSLESGVQLPAEGKNYEGYSTVARLVGRTYVHSMVKSIIVSAYGDLEKEQPTKAYKYAETGFREGGQFKPHKTHRNGLSVDFMTPVIDKGGNSVHLPTNILNKMGYDIEFNEKNEYDGMSIDYEALAAHIVVLHKRAKENGHDLWRVIFDPNLQPMLFETKYADYLKQNIKFSKKRSWVRHDEHYHVDFKIPCI